MDYGDLLYKAHENNKNAFNKEVRCYKTTFSPPKKLERKVSSSNIQKFLARREEEENKKKEEAKQRKLELLALRSQDKKAQRRVQTMLRATKSANKSVMEDAIDNVNTRDTLNGFKQCDEDDYGYVSQEASAFYNKLLNKYENMPPEPPKFQPAKREVKDLKAAKDRVKAALQKEADEEMLPHKRKKKKHGDKEIDDDTSVKKEDDTKTVDIEIEEKKPSKPKPKKPPPPALDFNQLLQIAQKKQFEPIMIDESLIKKEPERLMTKKQKLEAEKMASCKKMKHSRPEEGPSSRKIETTSKEDTQKKLVKHSKTEQLKQRKSDDKPSCVKNDTNKIEKKTLLTTTQSTKDKKFGNKEGMGQVKKELSSIAKSSGDSDIKYKTSGQISKVPSNTTSNLKSSSKMPVDPAKTIANKKPPKGNSHRLSDLEIEIRKMQAKQDELLRQIKEKDLAMKKMELSQRKETINKQIKREPEKKVVKKPIPEKKKVVPAVNKRRIDSDSEEYDSELDDFIDDGPDEGNDYSKYISEIFGYDKSKYSNVVDDDDDECMESNFAEISKEEFVSTKIGIMEDLEDIRKEQEEKKRLKEKKLRKMAEEKRNKKRF